MPYRIPLLRCLTHVRVVIFTLASFVLSTCSLRSDESAWTHSVSLTHPASALPEQIVGYVLPKTAPDQPHFQVEVQQAEGWKPLVSQLDPRTRVLYWLIDGSLDQATKQSYRLRSHAVANKEPQPLVHLLETSESIDAKYQDRLLVRFNKQHVKPPESIETHYGRSGHLHPVQTPTGALVTDEFPPDHAHQSGIYFGYPKTNFDGHLVDFWNLAKELGRVRFGRVVSHTSGPLFAEYHVINEHVDLNGATDPITGGRIAATEAWQVRVWRVGFQEGYWLLDIVSEMRCATEIALELPEYHYGGMAIRGARTWIPENVRFLTAASEDRVGANHSRPPWCDMTGTIDERSAGALLMTHPDNFRFPEPLRIHPTMPYMVYTPSYLGAWSIEPGQTHVARYRYAIHDGEFTSERCEALWRAFAQPLFDEK